jgi:hypothetical protein
MLQQVDFGENMVVLIPDDDGVFCLSEGETGQLPYSNALQTYVDLSIQERAGRGLRNRCWCKN